MCNKIFTPYLISLFLAIVIATHPTKLYAQDYLPRNPTNFYVSPTGNDNHPGTLAQPFRTISRAQNIVRTLNQNMSGDLVINLRGGYYPLSTPLTLDHRDSGSNGYFVIYRSFPGETALVSGGHIITNWQIEGNKWKANVGLGQSSRQLYVNGVRAVRARSDGVASGKKHPNGFTNANTISPTWANLSDIEIVTHLPGWKEFRCGVASVTTHMISVKQPCLDQARSQPGYDLDRISWIENAYELLDLPGEWYFNRESGWLYYLPRSGDNMATANVVLPTLETLIDVRGTATNPVNNLRFSGIVFAYATWYGPNQASGFAHVQAEYYGPDKWPAGNYSKIPANVTVTHGQKVYFERNVFTHLGGVGLNISDGSKNTVIVGNHFTDISAGAITLSNVDLPKTTDDQAISRANQIVNNYIHQVAVEYHGSVGIWVGYTQATRLANNEVFDLPYSGISIGWGWGHESVDPSVAKDNLIEHNLVYDVMRNFKDGGGIYSLGAQPGNVYRQNIVHDVKSQAAGIYLDNGSRYVTVTNNLIYQVNNNKIVNDNTKYTADNTVSGNDSLAGGMASVVNAASGLETAYQNIKTLPALPTPTSNPPLPPMPGDLSGDGHVNLADYNLLVAKFGNPYTIFDYNALVANFGT